MSGVRQIALSMVCPKCEQTLTLDEKREFQSEAEQLAYLEAEVERHLAECAAGADA